MENKLKIKNGFMIFFDGVRVDHLVRSFSTSHSVGGNIPSASITMGVSFGKGMTKEEYDNDYKLARANIILMRKVFKEGTKVIIAVKNVVSQNYSFIFNGSIKGVTRGSSKSKRFIALTISALGSLEAADRLESILSLPIVTQLLDMASVDAFKLKARGLDISNAKTINTLKSIKMNELTISQIKQKTKDALVATNRLYRDTASTQNFEAIIDRIKILSDIDERLIKADLLDLTVDVSTLKVETIYTTLSNALSRIMFEFYEMPYGDTLIKSPFWNTPILRDHIIPGVLIAEENDSMNFQNRATRALVSGGLSQSFNGTGITESNFKFAVPMTLYAEDLDGNGKWADVRNYEMSGTDTGKNFSATDLDSLWRDPNGATLYSGTQTGNAYLDAMASSGYLNHYNLSGFVKYIEYGNPAFAGAVYHIGWKGTVEAIMSNPLKEYGAAYGPKTSLTPFEQDRTTIVVRYDEGPYKGFKVFYGGVKNVNGEVLSIGDQVKDGSLLGRTKNLTDIAGVSNLYITVMYPDYQEAIENNERSNFLSVSPIAVFRDFYAGRKEATSVGVKLSNIDELSIPRDSEFLYGMKYVEENQPIIRFLTTTNDNDVIETLKSYTIFRLKSRNANVSTMNISTAIPMPWIYPGFNVWVEPELLDEVYYVDTVNHNGSADGVVSTNLFLTMGRDGEEFFTGAFDKDAGNDFGTLMSGGTFGANIFLSNDAGAKAFFAGRDTIDSFSEKNHYKSLKEKALKFATQGTKSYDIKDDEFMKYLYGTPKKANVMGTSPADMADLNMSGEYTDAHITKILSELFSKNTKSGLIKKRNEDIARFIASAEAIKKFY